MAGTKIGTLLDKVAQAQQKAQTAAGKKPAGAGSCALAEFGCDGWFDHRYSVAKVAGTLIGLCPRLEQHAQIVAENPEARRVRARIYGLFAQNQRAEAKAEAASMPARVTA